MHRCKGYPGACCGRAELLSLGGWDLLLPCPVSVLLLTRCGARRNDACRQHNGSTARGRQRQYPHIRKTSRSVWGVGGLMLRQYRLQPAQKPDVTRHCVWHVADLLQAPEKGSQRHLGLGKLQHSRGRGRRWSALQRVVWGCSLRGCADRRLRTHPA